MSDTPLPPLRTADTAQGTGYESRAETGHFALTGSPLEILLTPDYLNLLAEAASQVRLKKAYRFSLILAHAACDLATEGSLVELLRRRKVDLLREFVMGSLRQGTSLDNRKARRLFALLASENPAGDSKRGYARASWWDDWHSSRKLRHRVAHAGHQVQEHEALSCIAGCEHYIRFLAETVGRVARECGA